MVKLEWKFNPRPWSDNAVWHWPACVYVGPANRIAAYIKCPDQFNDTLARAGAHAPLTVVILKYNHPNQDPLKPREMEYTEQKFTRLEQAMAFVLEFLSSRRHWQPILI